MSPEPRPLSDYLRDTICLVAFLTTAVEANLDEDSASARGGGARQEGYAVHQNRTSP
jgi:hypothetical protein